MTSQEIYDLIQTTELDGSDWHIFRDVENVFLIKRDTPEGDYVYMSSQIWKNGSHDVMIEAAVGDILIAGLGLGYDALAIKDKPEVTSIDVVEIQQDVITLNAHLADFPDINIIHSSIMSYFDTNEKLYDVIWMDIFPGDISYFPEEKDILTTAANNHLKEGGKLLFWRQFAKLSL